MADYTFQNKIAVVTGGSEGIGFGIANAIASRGSLVYLIARNLENLEKAKSKIEKSGGRAEIRPADITKFEQIKDVIDSIYQKHNRLDIFVNNAGTWKGQNIDTPFEEIWKLIELDMKAPYQIAHYLTQKFKSLPNKEIKILTVASQAAVKVFDLGLGYGPAKMGLVSALHHLQKQMESEKIINVHHYRLYPNTVATEKIIPHIKKGEVQNPVSLEAVVDTTIDLISDKTPTRDVRIGYYPGKGIVRSYFPSHPDRFYNFPAPEEIVNLDWTPKDLLK